MFSHLQIYEPRERLAVGVADAVLGAVTAPARLLRRGAPAAAPRRILLLRLERIGDLLMSAAAIEDVRRRAPDAQIDLVVGSWNRAVAERLRGIDRVETLDAPWLARGSAGQTPIALVRRALGWRRRGYDLAINFEGDIRSHLLMALSGARVRVGFPMAGGGPLLTTQVPHDPTRHTSVNAANLVAAAFGGPPVEQPFRLDLPDDAIGEAAALTAGADRYITVHASGGRAIKQWDLDRFADVAGRLARDLQAAIVLTGAPGDAPLVARVRAMLPPDVHSIDLTGTADLLTLAAVLSKSLLVVTGDTGPMHLAAAVGAPTVAVFGPSDPRRYAPLSTRHRVVRIDLPCAPCNRIRRPPERCQGHTPDCLTGVSVEAVYRAARDLLESPR